MSTRASKVLGLAIMLLSPIQAWADGLPLTGKRVVILTHAVPGVQRDFLAIDRELARELVPILREKIKKVDIVDPSKVWDWAEAHPSWTDPAEAARAFEADVVIFLEVEGFQIADPSSPNLYQGVSKVHIRMTELKHPVNSKGKPMTDQLREAEVILDSYRDIQFPSRGHMPDTGISRASFKNKFLTIVAADLNLPVSETKRRREVPNDAGAERVVEDDHRLADMERKLDLILKELEGLRRR